METHETINRVDFHFGYYSLQLRNICDQFFLSLLTICTAEVALNLPTTPFLFVLSDIFPAARAIKPHLHATSGFLSGIGVFECGLKR